MLDFLKGLLNLFWGLRPPRPLTQEAIDTYHWSVSSLITLGYLIGVFHIVLICGYMPGNPGVAWAADVEKMRSAYDAKELELAALQKQLSDRQTIMAINQLKTSLKSSIKDACTAQSIGNQAALDIANNDIDDLQEQYQSLTNGRQYGRLPCEIVMIKSP